MGKLDGVGVVPMAKLLRKLSPKRKSGPPSPTRSSGANSLESYNLSTILGI